LDFEVVPNPVDLERFSPGPGSAATRRALDIGENDVVVTHPSNLKALKSRIKLYGLQFTAQKQREVAVPAYTGGLDVRVAVSGAADATHSSRGGGR
jgi:hypothetical protein